MPTIDVAVVLWLAESYRKKTAQLRVSKTNAKQQEKLTGEAKHRQLRISCFETQTANRKLDVQDACHETDE